MYTIYEIPGVKVGCTSRSPEVRVKEQGHTQFRVIEEVEDINIASERERYWQEKLGYRKDLSTYTGTLRMSKLANTPQAIAKWKVTAKASERWKESQAKKNLDMNSIQAKIKKAATRQVSERWKSTRSTIQLNTPEAKAKASAARKKAILQFTKQNNFVKEWSSVKEAAIGLGIDRGNISSCLTEKIKSAGGYIWKYKSVL